MKNLSVKTILRGFSAFALCASLSMGSALAYNGDPELAYTDWDPTHVSAPAAPVPPAAPDTTPVPAPVAVAVKDRLNQLKTGDVIPRTVQKSTALAADSVITSNFKNLGSFRLSFYCSCEKCSGTTYAGKTKVGTTITEGRTIAVDPSVIPLGSRVYINGYGLFIAEDIGSAIKGQKIDIAVSDHDHAYELGIDNATAYLVS